jgi:hypothetical protein
MDVFMLRYLFSEAHFTIVYVCRLHCSENNGASNCGRLQEVDADQTWRFADVVRRQRKMAGVSVETRT